MLEYVDEDFGWQTRHGRVGRLFEGHDVDGTLVGPLCGGDEEGLGDSIMELDVVVVVVVGQRGGGRTMMLVDGGHGGGG